MIIDMINKTKFETKVSPLWDKSKTQYKILHIKTKQNIEFPTYLEPLMKAKTWCDATIENINVFLRLTRETQTSKPLGKVIKNMNPR